MFVQIVVLSLLLLQNGENKIGHSSGQAANRTNGHSSTQLRLATAVQTPAADAKDKSQNPDPNKNDPAYSDTWILVFTGILALMAIFQFGAMILQWIVMCRQAEYIANAERAWLMVEFSDTLDWPMGKYRQGNKFADISLTCRNDGSTPCWIEEIRATGLVITRDTVLPDIASSSEPQFTGPLPVGARTEAKPFRFDVDITGGMPDLGEQVVIYGIVSYRHQFDKKLATTTFAYWAVSGQPWKRLQNQPKYNSYT